MTYSEANAAELFLIKWAKGVGARIYREGDKLKLATPSGDEFIETGDWVAKDGNGVYRVYRSGQAGA